MGLGFRTGSEHVLKSSARLNPELNQKFHSGEAEAAELQPEVRFGSKRPRERRLSIPSVLLDAFDLVCNHHGIEWSQSSKPSPSATRENLCPSIPGVLARLLIKVVAFDTAPYLMQYNSTSLNDPTGDPLFDPSLSLIPRFVKAAILGTCGAVAVYTTVDVLCRFGTLISGLLLHRPD
jgi:hypothetical protein